MKSDHVENVARAWASIDGKLAEFEVCKMDPEMGKAHGYYEGYMAEARELLKRSGLSDLIERQHDLMTKAHAVMRECGWQLAISAEPAGDGILEAACTEIEADFAEHLSPS